MRISKVKDYLIRRYFNDVTRERSLLLLGPPGIGKSLTIDEAAQEIAKKLGKKFIRMRLRWKDGEFVITEDGQKSFQELLKDPTPYFVLCDIRLSTIAPERSNSYIPVCSSIPHFYKREISILPGRPDGDSEVSTEHVVL